MASGWKRKKRKKSDYLAAHSDIELDTGFTFTDRINTKRVRQRVESELG